MSLIKCVAAWKCDYADCGHIWLKNSDKVPERCAKCRRRRWFQTGPAVSRKPRASKTSAKPQKEKV